VLIGEWHESILIPSHELIARFSTQFAGQRFALTGDQVKTWLNGGDLRGVDTSYPVGSIIVLEDDKRRFIGRGKVLRERVRNLLPRH
jgi:NOL1/NOP2/fmu family ribosome biogenesis protein